ncbi:hypothetical protein SETIT_1G037000v2 [Setaria italica]|uniref:Receptor kinase-like protein Xa21 n=3 Tax=Setaria italica TaxID=4555 RepID=A0A368PGH2_SETIT|nr:hypothetical protein SETIT_1G037000v2 [Setaria italica]
MLMNHGLSFRSLVLTQIQAHTPVTSFPDQKPPGAMVVSIRSLLLAIVILQPFAGALTPASMAGPATATATTNAAVVSTDHLALMAFKSLIKSDPSQALASWGNRSVPICQWHGVACGVLGHRRGHVVALDLAELNLLGTISPSIGNLSYLRHLSLRRNRLHGVLPPELGHLQELKHLSLSYNFIEGQIPVSLSNCSRMKNMLLYSNKFRGQIPGELGSLHNLEVLAVGINRLTGSIPSSIWTLLNLQMLIVEYNNLTGEISPEIGNLANLTVLGFGSNQFSGPIPASIGNLSELNFFSFSTNNLTGSIPPLEGLSSLTVFELDRNNLKGRIPAWLGNLSSLVTLNLDRNSLEGNIPEALGNLGMLTVLSLSTNNLQGTIPHSIGNLHSLQNLHIDYNNELEGPLPPSIFNMSSLEVLDLQGNRLNGSFPPDLGNTLPALQLFLASENQFHGSIPPSLCNASMIQWIQTVDNLLSGTIPDCLGVNQKNLSVLTFAENQLETRNDRDWGFMFSLTNCSSLQLLDVGDNRLRGELPNSVGNLSKSMWYFGVNFNSITGNIPEGIGNLVGLNFINLGNNLFDGPIPDSLGKLKKLNRLYLSINNLSGSIPSSISNLQMLNLLSLGGNALGGEIPPSLSSCPLQVLDLSYNSLTGSIPKELFFISTMSDSLHLEHNFLSGSLPSDVGNLKNLRLLDLSDNRFSGEIPSSLGECHSLQHLNTSGNFIQGKIPPSLQQLRGLQVLDLSHNNLSGSIPTFLESMSGLVSLNLSFNNLEGDVPKNGIFSNASAVSIVGNDGLCNGIPQLKLPPCLSHSTNKKKPTWELAITISTCSVILFIILVTTVLVHHYHTKKEKSKAQIPLISEPHMRISYAELASATNSFASENLIGAGSFGSVYKGSMTSNGQQLLVAVKVLNLTQRGASQSFFAECETLRCIRHRNLVKILTVCSSIDFHGGNFKALVYEFLPNGNLDRWVHQHPIEDGEHKATDISLRAQIAIDVASALEYLHQSKPLPIIHCDLKPSNVLLDSGMVAHVGDFGLARFLHQDADKSSGWASMRGTIGYVAPEYGLGNEASTHGDVYSYGILLLELFTGKRPTDSEFGEGLGLHKYVEMALPDRVATVVDKHLLQEIKDGEGSASNSTRVADMKISCITSILQVGVQCSEEIPTDRMEITDAVKELQGIRDRLQKHLCREETQLS